MLMHYFVPKRCTESNKIMYHDKATAQQAADQSYGYIVANSAEHGI